MRVAIDLVKAGDAQAIVSAGNTGALMAISKFVLKMLPGIDRPAIIGELPSFNGSLHMLDLGANTLCSAEQLFQFGNRFFASRQMTQDHKPSFVAYGFQEIRSVTRVLHHVLNLFIGHVFRDGREVHAAVLV